MKKCIQFIVIVLFVISPLSFAQKVVFKNSALEAIEKYSKRIQIDKSSPGNSKGKIVSNIYYEESYFQLWLNGVWIDDTKTIEIFDTTAKRLEMETHQMVQGYWVPNMRYVIEFDIINNTSLKFLGTEIYQYSDSAWVLAGTSVYNYDSNNFLVEIISSIAMGGNLLEYSKTIYTNNNAGKPLVEIEQNVNFSNFQFENEEKMTYTYNPSNDLELLTALQSLWVDGEWRDTAKTIYTRNNKLNPLTVTDQIISNGSQIENSWLTEYTYDSSGEYELTLVNKYWNSNEWLNNSRATFTYTNTNEVSTIFYESFQGGVFVNNARNTYSYDGEDRLTEELSESYVNGNWLNSYRIIYFYTPTSVKENIIVNNFSLNQNYPNPFNPTTTISFALPVDARVVLDVFNLLGEHVMTLLNEDKSAGTHQVSFNGSSLSSGIYLYRLSANNFTSVRKFVLMK